MHSPLPPDGGFFFLIMPFCATCRAAGCRYARRLQRGSAARETCFREARYIGKCVTAAYSFIPYNRHYARAWPQAAGTH